MLDVRRDAGSLSLAALIDPIPQDVFLTEYWSSKPLVAKHDARLVSGLFGLDELEQYLFTVQPKQRELQIVRSGQPAPMSVIADLFGERYSLQAAYSAFAQGYTIVVDFVHERWPPVARLVTHLEDTLKCRVQTNAYATGEHSQGFSVHTDSHDVFVLQTHGSKRWKIYPKPGGEPPDHPADTPLIDVELTEGDVLYLPQGFPHAAQTADGCSIHLSIGVHHYTWVDLITEIVHLSAASDPQWRQPVSWAALLGTEAAPTPDEIEHLVKRALSTPEIVSRSLETYRRRLAESAHRRNPPPSGYLESLALLNDLDADSALMRRPGVACTVTCDPANAYVHFLGETIRAPRSVEAALLFVEQHETFRVRDLPGMSDRSRLVLARRLIREGLLQLAP